MKYIFLAIKVCISLEHFKAYVSLRRMKDMYYRFHIVGEMVGEKYVCLRVEY